MSYDKIKSEFVKKELQKTTWKDSEYIDDLMDIEKIILGTYTSTGTGYITNHLENKYPKQWKAIYLELNPEGYKKVVAWEKKEAERDKKEEAESKKKQKERYDSAKESWKKMGGRK